MKPALLLIDLQNDFLAARGLEPSAGQVIDRAAALLRAGRAAGLPVLHVWTTVSANPDTRMPHWRQTGRWICLEGTPGHLPPPALAPGPQEPIITKQFFNAFSNPALAEELARLGVDTLILAGVHLHACVRNAALEAYERGFKVIIAHDATGSDDPVHAALTRRYLQDRAVQFCSVLELTGSSFQGTPAGLGQADDADLSRKADAARAAQLEWAGLRSEERGERLRKLASDLEQHTEPLARQLAREIGKPIFHARLEVARTAGLIRDILSRREEPAAVEANTYQRRPLGLVAVITPWNNPVLIPLGKIIAALYYGNAVLWKPAPAAVGLAHLILRHLLELNLPKDLLGLVEGDERAALALMAHPAIDAVTLTGGAAAGRAAQEICARRHVPLQAELGGNNVAIVWPDTSLAATAARIADGAFAQAGQRCTANRRVIVHEECYDPFLTLLERETAALPWGDPLDERTRIGPLLHPRQREIMAALVERAAMSPGTRVIIPPVRLPEGLDPARFHPPAIICCEDPNQEIVQEESFGPILVVQRASSWEEAMRLCNGVRQGLVAALFSSSPERQQQFLRQARAGVLKINQATADVAVDLPFGGWKSSGVGPPEHGVGDREFYQRLQAVYQASRP